MKYRNFTRLGSNYPGERIVPKEMIIKPRLLLYFEFFIFACSFLIGGSTVISGLNIGFSNIHWILITFSAMGFIGAYLLAMDNKYFLMPVSICAVFYISAILLVDEFSHTAKSVHSCLAVGLLIWLFLSKANRKYYDSCH